jgi:hypothetical protein
MNIGIKNLYFILGLIIILSVSLITPNDASATFSAGPGTGSIDVVCGDDEYGLCGSDLNKLQLVNVVGTVFISVYSRPFNFNVSSGGTLVSNGSVPVNSNLTFSPSGNARGTWLLTGSVYDTPDMDGIRYQTIGYNPNRQKTQGITVNRPSTSDPSSIMGAGAVSCSGWTCTANSVGNASITVTFPGSSVQSRSEPKYPNQNFNKCGVKSQYDCGYDEERIEYSEQSVTINFTVYQPNEPHTISYTTTNNISYNAATANWKYSDPEGDIQTNAQINIYTDSSRSILARPTINQSGSATNLNMTGLIPGTTYYPSIRVRNGPNGWSEWSNGTSFKTLPNNPPNLTKLSCRAISGATDYTQSKLEWDYIGNDEPGDELIVKAMYRRTPEDTNWILLGLPNTSTGTINILNLISGYTYEVQVFINDNRNGHLDGDSNRWKVCGNVTLPNYPVPILEKFNISGGTPVRITQYTDNPKRLTLKTGDRVSADWSIKDSVGLQSCSLSTAGFSGFTGSGLPSGSVTDKIVPTSLSDITYNVNLSCPGKPAKIVRTINEIINLTVESWPRITSCNINGNPTVKEGSTSISISANVTNSPVYRWTAGQNSLDLGKNIGDKDSPIQPSVSLEYKDIAFGRYTPWVRVRDLRTTNIPGATSRTVIRNCGTVSNLGTSNIREVN